MLTTTRHTRWLNAAESFARATFTGILPSGDGWTCQVASLQKEFKELLRLEGRGYGTLRTDLNNWRERVTRGDVEFDPAREDDLKEALRALVALEDCLIEKFDDYSAKGLFLAKTRFVGLVQAHRKAIQSILDSWKSPEWETVTKRTVKWDKEQTQHLRERLDSCK
jgi:hypothetical protein